MNVFENFLLITRFIPNYFTCFHNKLKKLSCKKLKTCNISRNFDTKT